MMRSTQSMPSLSETRDMPVTSESSWRYPGWRIVAVCHIGVLVGFATVFIYSFSLMVKPLQQEFGWNREQISRAFSLAAISVASCSPFMGKLFDRFEPHKIIVSFMVAFGLTRVACLAHAASWPALRDCDIHRNCGLRHLPAWLCSGSRELV